MRCKAGRISLPISTLPGPIPKQSSRNCSRTAKARLARTSGKCRASRALTSRTSRRVSATRSLITLSRAPIGRNQRPGASLAPDFHALLRREVQLLPRVDAERRIPRVDVAHGERTEWIGRMLVGGDDLAQIAVAHLARMRLAVGKEEALVAGQ